MCMGGGDTPQQPVQPAPYPWAELDVKDSRQPDPNAHGNETQGATAPAITPKVAAPTATGMNTNSLKM